MTSRKYLSSSKFRKFLNGNENYDKEILIEFAEYSNTLNLNFYKIFASIVKLNTTILDLNQLHSILDKISYRYKDLKSNNKLTSTIDLSYYKCYIESEEEALRKYKEYCSRKTAAGREAITKIPNIRTLEYSIKRLGLEKGTEHYNKVVENRKINANTNIDFWLRAGMSLEEAKLGDLEWKSAFGNSYIDSIKSDEYKYNLAIESGFKLYYIWSDDNLQNKLDEIKEIILSSLKVLA